jgi:hypothetical protein
MMMLKFLVLQGLLTTTTGTPLLPRSLLPVYPVLPVGVDGGSWPRRITSGSKVNEMLICDFGL